MTLEGDGFDVTYVKTSNVTLKSDGLIGGAEGVLISATSLKLIGSGLAPMQTPLI